MPPLFGRALEGPLGHIVDIVSVIATILGVSVTLGYGVSQFASGVYNITGMNWLMDVDGDPTKIAMIVSLVIVMIASTLSALSGVGKGIKWLSNINMACRFSCSPSFWSLVRRCLRSARYLSVCGIM